MASLSNISSFADQGAFLDAPNSVGTVDHDVIVGGDYRIDIQIPGSLHLSDTRSAGWNRQ